MLRRIRKWWGQRRLKRIDRRTKASENRQIKQLRSEVYRQIVGRAAEVSDIRGKFLESEKRRNIEEKEFLRRIEEKESEIERLQRELSLAELECEKAGAIIARDRARVDMEAATFERKASGLANAISSETVIE